MSFCSFSLVLNVAAFTFLAYREVTQRKRLRAKVKETAKKYQILMDGVQSDIDETINKLKAQRDDVYKLYTELQTERDNLCEEIFKRDYDEAHREVKAAAEVVKPKRVYKKKEAKNGNDPKKQK